MNPCRLCGFQHGGVDDEARYCGFCLRQLGLHRPVVIPSPDPVPAPKVWSIPKVIESESTRAVKGIARLSRALGRAS